MRLKISNGAVAFGANTVLQGVDFEINDGEKVALVGRNGSGKTTLLKLIVGEYELTRIDEEPSSISIPKSASIGYLRQVTFDDERMTLEDEVRRAYRELTDLEDRIERLLTEMEKGADAETARRCTEMQERFQVLGGYTYRKEYEVAIRQFGFSADDKKKPLSEFSGGQRTKIAFIRQLLSKPDLLMLDEPTNHLDIHAIEWLEGYLRTYPNAVLVVSHDREFLDRVVSAVYEIERGRVRRYAGNYSAFAEKKRLDWEIQQKRHVAQQKEIAHLSGLVERFRYKATKAAFAQSKLKQIERMEIVEAPELADTRSFHADFEPEFPSVQLVLEVRDLAIGYDRPLSTVNLTIRRGEKIGVIGGNGLGKSTFLKTIVGALPALGGRSTIGEKVRVGYFDQKLTQYTSEKSVLDEYWDEFPDLTQTEVRSALGAFLFSGDDVFKPVNVLSGGEKVRLELCKIMRRKPNFLILDEPTNHMDIIGKETLEKMLCDYTGTLLFVSHDRYLIKRVATSVLSFEGGTTVYYPYGYEQYLEALAKAAENEAPTEKEKRERKKIVNPGKERAKREARMKKLEQMMEGCDTRISEIQTLLSSDEVASDYMRITELQDELIRLEEMNLGYLEEWDSLGSEAEESGEG